MSLDKWTCKAIKYVVKYKKFQMIKLACKVCKVLLSPLKDAMFVSYNRSQILQYVLTALTLQKERQSLMTNNGFWTKQVN